ncbi:MAG: nucleotidyl transferase AbiEii/AbiGii toxin family protein [Atribacterota bacterium]
MIDIKQISEYYPDKIKPFKKNILREYLQYKILDIIYDSKYFDRLVFMGGTAIRIVHGNTRFSEDLDFDNRGMSEKEFRKLVETVKRRIELEGYKLETRIKVNEAFKCSFKFLGLLYRTGISLHKKAKLVIQLDTEPQNYNYEPEKVMLNKFEIFTRILAVPPATLLSQKICAVFTRPRSMGKDFFDIVYLTAKTEPDMNYLEEKLGIKSVEKLRKELLKKCEQLDFKQLAKDVEPFLYNSGDSKKILLFRDFLEQGF